MKCFLDINNWYHNYTYKLNDTVKGSRGFEFSVKIKNYLTGKMFTYNPLQKFNSSSRFIFDIHTNISFYMFIQDTKHNLLSNRPSLIQGYFNKYEVCKKCKQNFVGRKKISIHPVVLNLLFCLLISTGWSINLCSTHQK